MTARITAAATSTFVAMLVFAASASAQANVAGKWTFTVDGPEGPSAITATMAQDGAAVTGALEIPMFGGAEVSDGTIEGNTLSFLIHLDIEGQYFTVEVEADVDGDEMAGEFYLAEFGSMPFEGRRTDG